MALFHGVINSKALMKDTTLSMIVPSDDRKNIGFQGQPQLLILLHGAGGSNYTWSKYSSIERYTDPLNLIVLMPNIFYILKNHQYILYSKFSSGFSIFQ